MKRMAKAGALLAAVVGLWQVTAGASGSAMSMGSLPKATPEQMAAEAYNSGIGHKDKGVKIEEKDPAKAKSEYEKALKDFEKAAKLKPDLPQAYNGMGFALRKTGDFEKSLEMYSKALELAPGFPDAIEYRGESFLAVNKIDEAKQAYLDLFANDRKQADILMKAMTDWIGKRHADAAGVDPAALAAFETWARERATLAGQTENMALTPARSSWQ
jgi:tetratricopeptide (TPR) repeat protein